MEFKILEVNTNPLKLEKDLVEIQKTIITLSTKILEKLDMLEEKVKYLERRLIKKSSRDIYTEILIQSLNESR